MNPSQALVGARPEAREERSPQAARIANSLISLTLMLSVVDAIHSLAVHRFVYLRIECVFLVILVASYWFRPNLRANFVLVLIGSILALTMVEIVLTVTGPIMTARHVWKAGRVFDFRTREEVIQDMRKSGVHAYQRVAAGFPIAGGITVGNSISDATIVYGNETGQFTVFQSDEYGFNNPHGIWSERPTKIAAIGDSFATGCCVGVGNSFVDIIRNSQPATVNLGSGGNGPLVEFATVREYASSLKPGIVLWFFFEGNDLDDLRHESAKPTLMRYLRERDFTQNLMSRQAEIDADMKGPLENANNFRRSTLLIPSIGLRYYGIESLARLIALHETHNLLAAQLGLGDAKNGWQPELAEIPLFREVMGDANDEIAQWGGQLYFVYLPGTDLFTNAPGRQRLRSEVLETVNELQIPVIDVYPAFRQKPDPLTLFSLPFPHYNVAGYRLTAEVVLHALQESSSAYRTTQTVR
jgi:hypothetical protein